MSFVILSTGSLAGSTLRTLKTRTVGYAAGITMLAILACGVAAGYRLGQTANSPGIGGPAADLDALAEDPDGPESRALIERVGKLSGRLIRLETEAVILARQLGLGEGGGPDRRAPADNDEPSGGPFVAAGGFPLRDPPNFLSADFGAYLTRLALDLDRIEATFARVAQATAVRNLDAMAYPSRLPLASGAITSGFGKRLDPFTRRPARHTGLDFRAPSGAPILASAGGRVRLAGRHGAYGKTVEIDHGDGLVTRYGHASKLFVRVGDIVLPGQRIAAVGSTGRSNGPHLHFEVLRNGTPVEPRLYLARDRS